MEKEYQTTAEILNSGLIAWIEKNSELTKEEVLKKIENTPWNDTKNIHNLSESILKNIKYKLSYEVDGVAVLNAFHDAKFSIEDVDVEGEVLMAINSTELFKDLNLKKELGPLVPDMVRSVNYLKIRKSNDILFMSDVLRIIQKCKYKLIDNKN